MKTIIAGIEIEETPPIDYSTKPDLVEMQGRLDTIENAPIGAKERSELFEMAMEILGRLEEIEARLAALEEEQ